MPVPMASALNDVTRTCHDLAQNSAGDVAVDAAAVAALAAGLGATSVQSSAVYVRIPIKFESVQAEINYLALYHLLDFGSGWDALLLEKARRDAHEIIQYGMLGMLMTDARMDHHFLREFTNFSVVNYFGVDASEESEVMPGITMTRQGPLSEFVWLLRDTCNETGRILGERGWRDLGACVLALVEAQAAGGQPPSAAALVEQLAETFPGFKDVEQCQGSQVYFYRKAQALAAQLYLRFRGEDPRFDFGDVAALSVDSGNVLLAVLRQAGVLRYSADMAAVVDAGEDLGGDPKEPVLRAAAVEAGQRICEAAGGAFHPYQLSLHLLHQAQTRPEYQQLKKHVARGTVAY